MDADILVRTPGGQSVLVAEIRNRQNLSQGVAVALRRNLASHNLLPPSKFFLLLSQDVGFLWSTADSSVPDAPPTVEFPMVNVVSRYLRGAQPQDRLRQSELQMLVANWLEDLAGPAPKVADEPEKTLEQTGFLKAIQGATVLSHAKV